MLQKRFFPKIFARMDELLEKTDGNTREVFADWRKGLEPHIACIDTFIDTINAQDNRHRQDYERRRDAARRTAPGMDKP